MQKLVEWMAEKAIEVEFIKEPFSMLLILIISLFLSTTAKWNTKISPRTRKQNMKFKNIKCIVERLSRDRRNLDIIFHLDSNVAYLAILRSVTAD